MERNCTKISITQFDFDCLILTEEEEKALGLFINKTEPINLREVEVLVPMCIHALARGMAKKVISNVIHFYSEDEEWRNEKLTIILFLSGKVVLRFINPDGEPGCLAGNRECFQVASVLTYSKCWKQVQDAFVKEMDALLGVNSYRICKRGFIRAIWPIGIIN